MLSLWCYLCLLFFVLEFGHPGLFYFLSLGIGSGVAASSQWFEHPIEWQLFVFFFSTFIAFILLHLFVRRTQSKHAYHSNVYALQGLEVVVVTDIIPPSAGTVKAQGTVWNAISIHGKTFTKGTIVTIINVKGITLIVDKLD
jgi:membrane protein implicated in regulation of membrane protease activity